MPLLATLLRNPVFEANPIDAGLQVDFERREADPSKYTISQKLHPANEEVDGGNDGMTSPYDGTQMGDLPSGMEGGMPSQPPSDDEMQQLQPGMQQPGMMMPGQQQQMPPMQESIMQDDFDIFLDDLLEGINDLTEAPFDWERQGNPGRNYAGYQGQQQAPASIVAAGPTAVANWQRQMQGPTGGNAPMPTRGGGNRGGNRGANRPAAPTGGPKPDDNVRALQQNLKAAGFDVGRFGVDGVMGKDTQAAMQQAKDKGYEFSPGGGLSQRSQFNPGGIAQNQNTPGGVADREKDLTPATAQQPGQNQDNTALAAAGAGGAAAAIPTWRGGSLRGNQPGLGGADRASRILQGNPGEAPTADPRAGVGRNARILQGNPGEATPPAAPEVPDPRVGVNRAGNLLNPRTNGVGDPRVGVNRAGQLLGQGAEDTGGGVLRSMGNMGRSAMGALGRAGSAVADAVPRVGSAAMDMLPGAVRAAAPRVAGFAANPVVGGAAMAMMPSSTSNADWNYGKPYVPPAGWDKAPGQQTPAQQPAPARPVTPPPAAQQPPPNATPPGGTQLASVQSQPPATATPPAQPQPAKESAMTWNDYMSLFEADQKKSGY